MPRKGNIPWNKGKKLDEEHRQKLVEHLNRVRPRLDLTGQKFGRLIVLKESEKRYKNDAHVVWLCRCDCGNFKEIRNFQLTRGGTKSCGCLRRERFYKHGDWKTRLYITWQAMKSRCLNPNFHMHKRYGGRGIQICSEWKNNFLNFKKWALENGYRNGLTIDRIDNDGNYEPGNCQFLTRSENSRKGRN